MMLPMPRWSLESLAEQAFRQMAAVNVVGVVAGTGARITEANDYFLDLVGRTRAELHAGTIDWPSPPQWPRTEEAASHEQVRHDVTGPYEQEYLTATGRRVPVLVGGAVVDRGPPPRWVAFILDLRPLKATLEVSEDERSRLTAAADVAQQRLSFLAQASALIAALPDFPGLYARLARHVVPLLADICLVDVAEGDEVHRVAAAAVDPTVQALLDDALVQAAGGPSGPLRRLLASGRPEWFDFRHRPQEVAAVLGAGTSAHVARGRSALLVPLAARGRALGALTLLSAPGAGPMSTDDRSLAEEFAALAALAVDNARLFAERTYVASTLQEALLPAELPALPGLDLAARYVAAEELADVGGDFYDMFPLPGDRGSWAVVIGDVSGRGVEAAGLTGLARHTLRALSHDLSPAEALSRLNEVLFRAAEGDRFLTAALLTLRPPRGEGDGVEVTVSSAGHCAPILLRAHGAVTAVDVEGSLLGVFRTVDLAETRLRLDPGDLLLLYTDGVTEARGAHGMFGEQRLAELLARCVDMSAEAVVDRVVEAVAGYRAGAAAADDQAVLAIRVLPRARRAEPSPAQDLDAGLPARRVASRPAPAVTGSAAPVVPASLPVYGLTAVARLTGTSAATVQTWAGRYGLVVGHRTGGGHELFTRDQLAALHYVAALVRSGVPEAEAHLDLGQRLRSGTPLPSGPVPAAERVLLLADRDPYAIQLTEHVLRTAGYRLTVATDVGNALAAAASPPDLAIIDLMISGGQGLELVRRLKRLGTGAVLAVSALRVADEALTAGADAFLPKPLQPIVLIAAVHDLLGTSAFLRPPEPS